MSLLRVIFPLVTSTLPDHILLQESSLSAANEVECFAISPGIYSTTRVNFGLSIEVRSTHDLTFRLAEIGRTPDDRMAENLLFAESFQYWLDKECNIWIHGAQISKFGAFIDQVQDKTSVFSGISIGSKLEYQPSVMGIRFERLSLTLLPSDDDQMDEPCSQMRPGHYVQHVAGVTAVVRVLENQENLVLTLALPSAHRPSQQHLSTTIVAYTMDSNCFIKLGVTEDTRMDDLKMIKSAFLLMSGSSISEELVMRYSPISFEIVSGSLALLLDMPLESFVDEKKFEELNIGSSDNEEETLPIAV